MPTYDSMEAYALSVINALKQPNGYTYYILPDGAQSSADGTPIEVTEAAADVRVTELEKRCHWHSSGGMQISCRSIRTY